MTDGGSAVRRAAAPFWAAALVACAACASAPPGAGDVDRERAVATATAQVSFQPSAVDAVRTTAGGTPIWRVTLRGRLPGQPPELFETVVVEIDRRTGEVVRLARP